jgi:hypothetical protein
VVSNKRSTVLGDARRSNSTKKHALAGYEVTLGGHLSPISGGF